MGLDMFLTKQTYVRKYGNNPPILTLDYPGIKTERVSYIHEEIGYWRKANAIHQWFVANVQDGVDKCQESYAPKESLMALADIVAKVQANHSLAPTLLPSQDGFFFGSTDYDEYYFNDLEDTRKILESALAEDCDYYYRASW